MRKLSDAATTMLVEIGRLTGHRAGVSLFLPNLASERRIVETLARHGLVSIDPDGDVFCLTSMGGAMVRAIDLASKVRG